jgi:hypothetical protein
VPFNFGKKPMTEKPPKPLQDPKDLLHKPHIQGREHFDPNHIVSDEEGGNEDTLRLYETGEY